MFILIVNLYRHENKLNWVAQIWDRIYREKMDKLF